MPSIYQLVGSLLANWQDIRPTHMNREKNVEALEPLVQCTVQAARAGDFDTRALANIAYGVACSGGQKRMGALFMALASAAEWRKTNFNA